MYIDCHLFVSRNVSDCRVGYVFVGVCVTDYDAYKVEGVRSSSTAYYPRATGSQRRCSDHQLTEMLVSTPDWSPDQRFGVGQCRGQHLTYRPKF